MKKGKIHSIENGGTHARVVPSANSQIVTNPLVVPYYWRKEMGNLQVGDEVFYDEDEALDGIIHGRTDGEWDAKYKGTLGVTQDLNVGQTLNASTDAIGGGKSLKTHSHTGNLGSPTSLPN